MNLLSLANTKLLTVFPLVLSLLVSCNPKPTSNNDLTDTHQITKQVFSLVNPKRDFILRKGQPIEIQIKTTDKDILPDSIHIYIGADLISSLKNSSLLTTINATPLKLGKQNLRVVVYFNDSLSQNLNCPVVILSDTKPILLRQKVIRSFPHDESSYTQGFIYYNHALYEGTGRNGNSKLRKIDPMNGKVLKEIKLDNEFFGEGITIFNNEIYQLTYLSKVGFIYDLESFELIRKFDLQTSEGWGLTNDSKNLISSDGSSILYFYDPEYLTQVSQIDVCDDKGPITNLNELEYIEGYIYANVYGEPVIVKIDAQTGAVVAKLDLQSIFPENIPLDIDHVLNGIAFNHETKTFFVTGKLWPIIYEINIFE